MFPLSDNRRRLLLLLALFLLALLPRLSAVDRYVTPDELNWVFRSVRLRQALLAQDWGETLRSGHPGVTTTWLGAAAIQVQLWLEPAVAEHLSWLDSLYWLGSDSVAAYRRLAVFLNGGRLAVALVTSLGVSALYLLAEEPVGTRAALLGALLLALDPFAAGLAGLLHVDALLATFMMLALLMALRTGRTHAQNHGAVLATGLFTALALLTKTPGLLLLPIVGLILLPLRPSAAGWATPGGIRAWRALLLWLVTTILTLLILLPALWSAPRATFETLTGLTGRLVENAVRPSFFLGETGFEHGPLFYPVAVLFRLSPAATLGLLALPYAAIKARHGSRIPGWRSAGWFLLFSLLLLLLVTVVAKKHDRYALPALMALTMVAGWAMVMAAEGTGSRISRAAFFVPVLLQVAFLLAALPYPLTAYNWLVGGTGGAYRALPAGWGEGASAAARRLALVTGESNQPALFASSTVSTAPFYEGDIFRRRAAFLSLLRREDYLLVTAGERQDPESVPIASVLRRRPPAETIYINGREQAWLYTGLTAAELGLPSLETVERNYRFDGGPEIVAGGAAFLAWPRESLVAIQWQVPEATAVGTYRLQLQVADDRGQIRAVQEQPLLNEASQPPSAWPAGRRQNVYYTQPIPPDLRPGNYQVVATLFDAQGARLGVFDAEGNFAGIRAPVATVTVEPPPSQPPLAIPQRSTVRAELVGHAPMPATVGTGAPLTLDLWWQTDEPGQYLLALSLGEGGQGADIEPWLLDAASWIPGQTYNIRPRWRLPAELAGGIYPLHLRLLDTAGRDLWPAPVTLGEVRVETWERSFELPAGLRPLGIEVGTLAFLQSVSLERSGNTLEVTTLWQAQQGAEINYTAFVHLLDAAGNIVDQVDRPLSPPTTSWVTQQVIGESYSLTIPAAGGDYRIALGVYDARSGVGLPLYEKDERLANDRYLLEVPER